MSIQGKYLDIGILKELGVTCCAEHFGIDLACVD
jgi:hypothetical protein